MSTLIRRVSLLALSAAMLSGCATPNYLQSKQASTEGEAKTAKDFASVFPEKRAAAVTENNGFWISKHVLDPGSVKANAQKSNLPAAFSRNVSIVYEPRATARTVGRFIAQSTKMPVNFTDDALSAASAAIYNNSLRLDDRLTVLLDDVAQRADLSWRYINGGIEFYALETRVFEIAAVPGTSDFTATLGAKNASSGGSGSSGGINSNSGQTLSIKNSIDFYKALREELGQIIPDKKFTLSDSKGTLIVTANPRVIRQVESYIKTINENRLRQVMVSVNVYSVTMDSSDSYGLDWSLVYKSLSQSAAIGLRSPGYATQTVFDPITGQVTLGAMASNGSTGMNMMILDNGTHTAGFSGSDMLLSALSKQGATKLITSVAAVTSSDESVPVNVTKETSYLASVSTTAVSGGVAQSSLTPGTITTGFSLNLLPKILANDSVYLQAAIDLSSLDGMALINSASMTIQVPEKSVRSFMQKVNMKSGQTLVIGGFQQVSNKFSSSGVGEPDVTVAGGSRSGATNRTTLILTLTPFIINANANANAKGGV